VGASPSSWSYVGRKCVELLSTILLVRRRRSRFGSLATLTIWALVSVLCLTIDRAGGTPLIGTSAGGSLCFNGGQLNFFEPANGFVPVEYLNYSGCSVEISGSATEFGFADETAEISANFTGAQLIITDRLLGDNSYNSFQLLFTNSTVTSLTAVSDTFPTGGLTGSLSGGGVTLDWAGGVYPETTFEAVFEVTLPPPPILSIRLTLTNTAVISWPSSFTDFALEEKGDVTSTNWTLVGTTPSVTNGENQVAVWPTAGARFYRLKRQ
jgi:hypothetical protein